MIGFAVAKNNRLRLTLPKDITWKLRNRAVLSNFGVLLVNREVGGAMVSLDERRMG
jgi:hypothetical protein